MTQEMTDLVTHRTVSLTVEVELPAGHHADGTAVHAALGQVTAAVRGTGLGTVSSASWSESSWTAAPLSLDRTHEHHLRDVEARVRAIADGRVHGDGEDQRTWAAKILDGSVFDTERGRVPVGPASTTETEPRPSVGWQS